MPRYEDFIKPPSEGYGWFTKVISPKGTEYWQRNLRPDQREEAPDGESDIEWNFRFDIYEHLNRGEIKIFNCLPEQVYDFPKGDLLTLKAGWLPETRDTVLIIRGTIEKCSGTIVPGRGFTMDIEFCDASDRWLTQITNRHWPPGVKASTCFKTIVSDITLKLAKFSPLKDPSYPLRGKTFFRPAWMALWELANDMKSKVYVYNREVYLLKPKEGIPVPVLLDDGTHGNPVLIRQMPTEDEVESWYHHRLPDEERKTAWRVRTLMHPLLKPDALIWVDTDGPRGEYRVAKGEHWCKEKQYLSEIDIVYRKPDPIVLAGGWGTISSEDVEKARQRAAEKKKEEDKEVQEVRGDEIEEAASGDKTAAPSAPATGGTPAPTIVSPSNQVPPSPTAQNAKG